MEPGLYPHISFVSGSSVGRLTYLPVDLLEKRRDLFVFLVKAQQVRLPRLGVGDPPLERVDVVADICKRRASACMAK